MRKKRPRKTNSVENVSITALSHTGKGIARIDNKVVFVEDTVPGDIADILIIKDKKDYAEAKVLRFLKTSELRIQPQCTHFGTCGGCQLMNLPYEFQLEYKQNIVTEDFKRISHLTDYRINPISAASQIFFFRNKMEYSFSANPWFDSSNNTDYPGLSGYQVLGLHVRGRFDKVVDIQQCYLQDKPGDMIRNTFRILAQKHHLDFYNKKTNRGFIKTLMIRITKSGETMVCCMFSENQPERITAFLEEVPVLLPQIDSLFYFINEKVNDSFAGLEPVHFYGKPYITEKIGHLYLRVGPKSFLQTNSHQSAVLFSLIEKFCELSANEILYDLYCGVGSIGLFLARHCKKVIGIESVPESVAEADQNKLLNSIDNIEFITGFAEKELTEEFVKQKGVPDIIIVDPPRAGLHSHLIKTLCQIKPEKLIYVSCNPATQARDAAMLQEYFKLIEIQPVDMFPHTLHVENIALFKLK